MDNSEKITIEFDLFKWDSIRNYLKLTNEVDFIVKTVKVKDDMFTSDEVYKALKKNADKEYKKLDEYMFKIRHNIK